MAEAGTTVAFEAVATVTAADIIIRRCLALLGRLWLGVLGSAKYSALVNTMEQQRLFSDASGVTQQPV